MLVAALALVVPLLQDALVARPPRMPLPKPVAGAPLAATNDNRTPAGRLVDGTLHVALDVVEAAFQAEGPNDPVVRALAFAEAGKAPTVPGPLLRAPAGTPVRITFRNRSDSAVMLGGLRQSLAADADTLHLAAGASREVAFRVDSVGTFHYWAVLKGLTHWTDREWLDSQLSGAMVVDPAGTPFGRARDRVWVVTEWFHGYRDRPFESALAFNGKAWPYTERLALAQNDSVHWRFVNAAAVPHPMHLHGFYFRVTRRGGERADTAIAHERQALQNVQVMEIGGTMALSFVPTTPGNWVFHCHFASHVGAEVSLAGSPDAHVRPEEGVRLAGDALGAPKPHAHGADPGTAHNMSGLVLGIVVTPAKGYREQAAADRRTIRLHVQKAPRRIFGAYDAYGFALQKGDSAPAPNTVQLPGPVLELRRGEPVRILVTNRLAEATGVHWHGLEIESFPDGVPGISGMGSKVMPPIAPGDSFAAEFTPPRSGTYPYHAHMHELRQIGSGMYGAIIVTDAPRDTTRDHLIVVGGAGPPIQAKQGNPFLLVNGRGNPRPLKLVAGETHRLRFVSIHADWELRFRLGDDTTAARWTPIAKDGADLPPALRVEQPAVWKSGPGETADFEIRPTNPGRMTLEIYGLPVGFRVPMTVEVVERK